MTTGTTQGTATRKRGIRTFLVVWSGQFVSLVGSGLTGFALAVWVYQQTGSATQLSLILLAAALPQIVMSPIAGALVDRWDRRWAMILSDTGAAAGTLGIAFLLFTDRLEIWHIFVLIGFSSVFQSFQWPAYTAATTLLVPKEHYGRAAGLVQLAEALGHVISPALAGVLLLAGGLETVIFIDFATFLFAVGTLLLVRFPRPERSEAGKEGTGSIWSEARYGWRYIVERQGLFALLVYFSAINLIFGFVAVLVFPLVLAFASEGALGLAVSIGGIGMVLGSLIMSAWGGPKRRVYGVLGFDIILSVALIVVGLRPSIVLVVIASFSLFFAIPFANGSSQALWQAKVEPDVQGRVFAVRRVFAQASAPIAYILAGPLADRVFEPMLDTGGALAGTVGAVIGIGEGRGIGLMFIVLGAFGVVITAVAFAYPRLRYLEDEIPDAAPETPPAVEESAQQEPRIGDAAVTADQPAVG